MNQIYNRTDQYKRKSRLRRFRRRALAIACLAVAALTVYTLTMPAFTLESGCQLSEHSHGRECYEQLSVIEQRVLACSFEAHVHTAECSAGCAYADYVIHYHTADCYLGEALICTLPAVEAHSHSESCYQVHSHADVCYEEGPGPLVCQLTEDEGHAHSAECEQRELSCPMGIEEGHEHSEACYTVSIVCGQEEREGHLHAAECYGERALVCTEDTETPQLICTRREVIAHTHSDACFTTGAGGERVCICPLPQVLEHSHSDSCFEIVQQPTDNTQLNCSLPEDANHSHSEMCYGSWQLVCRLQEHTHDDSCKAEEMLLLKSPGAPSGQHTHAITVSFSEGLPGQEIDFLNGTALEPAEEGAVISIAEISSTDESFVWDGASSRIIPSVDVEYAVYTIIFEAHNSAGELLATKSAEYVVRRGGISTGRLDGDWAYISALEMVADSSTASGQHIRTGSAPWDDDDSAGNDKDDRNAIVRSFDTVSYTVSMQSKTYPNSPYTAYRSGVLHYEFVIPMSADKARFEESGMAWLTAKKDAQYQISESTLNGQPCQVLRGSFLWEPAGTAEDSVAIGESIQTLNVAIRMLAATQGETVQPYFTFWLDHNKVPESGLVTGSEYSCGEHGKEYMTVRPATVTVSSAPRFNVAVVLGQDSTSQKKGVFDFDSGKSTAPNHGAGLVDGRIAGLGVTIQMMGKSTSHGLRGCELPDGSPISIDISLESLFSDETVSNRVIDVTGDYMPLLYGMEGNQNDGDFTLGNGRKLITGKSYPVAAAPSNANAGDGRGCYNGGNWTATQNGNVISVTVSDYQVKLDLASLPAGALGDAAVSGGYYSRYYDQRSVKNAWEVQTACFSAAELWIVQPFYDGDEYILDRCQNSADAQGSFNVTIAGSRFSITGESGVNTSGQMNTTDDRPVFACYIKKVGGIEQASTYQKYGSIQYNLCLTDGCQSNGKDWTVAGGQLTLATTISHDNAEDVYLGAAYDQLMKFDDRFFEPEQCRLTADAVVVQAARTLWAAKPDGTGWNHNGLSPNEAGYDNEMINATAEDLVYFESLAELQGSGYVCVGLLVEWRHLGNDGGINHIWARIDGRAKTGEELNGQVFMLTHSCRAWYKGALRDAVAEWAGKEALRLTDEDYNAYLVAEDGFPSRVGQTSAARSYAQMGYPEASWINEADTRAILRNYNKPQYDESGYKGGTANNSIGDSCLVVSYTSAVTKRVEQTNSDGVSPKLAYDLDSNQRIVDYAVVPTIKRGDFDATTEQRKIITTVYVEDTLPAGLSYIAGSASLGGEYTMNGQGGGYQGSVSGGTVFEPQITHNSDGSTTLYWVIEDVELSGANTELPAIRYSCEIGGDGSRIENGDQLLNTAKVWGSDEQKRDFSITNGNLTQLSINVSKNITYGISKVALQRAVDAGDDMDFAMTLSNSSRSVWNLLAVDMLPYNGDAAGSSFSGKLVVSGLFLPDYASNPWQSGLSIYYSCSDEYRSASGSSINQETLKGWTKLSINADGSVTLPANGTDTAPEIRAIAFSGQVPAESALHINISLRLPDAVAGEHIINTLRHGALESSARSYIVTREMEGLAWFDANRNGAREADEARLNGIKVVLCKYWDTSKNTQKESAYSEVVRINTGQQCDLRTGEVRPYTDGAYKFVGLDEGIYMVRFVSSEGHNIANYFTTIQNAAGVDDSIDSDGWPEYRNEDKQLATEPLEGYYLYKSRVMGVPMPAADEINGIVYTSKHNDAGFYAEFSGKLAVYKVDREFTDLPLAGAEFELYEQQADGSWTCIMDEIVSDENGLADIGVLAEGGSYKLVEKKAPDGFYILDEEVKFTVNATQVQLANTVWHATVVPAPEGCDADVCIQVTNECGYKLPETGGIGNGAFIILGALLLAVFLSRTVLPRRRHAGRH